MRGSAAMPVSSRSQATAAGAAPALDDFGEILESLPHKVWMGGPSAAAIYCNRAVRTSAGANLEACDRASLEATFVHADDLPGVVSARAAALADGNSRTIEARLKAQDGGWRWHRLTISLLAGRSEINAWMASATDIHDLKQAFLLAQENAEQLRLAAASTQLGVYSFDLETRQHEWSSELKAIFGLPASAPAPREIAELVHPEDREKFEALRRESFDASSRGGFQDEHRIVRRDGSVRWVFVKGKVSFAGEGAARQAKSGLGFVLDITERKIAEQALAHSEERYRLLVDTANDIVATLDLEGRFTSINPAVKRILGYEPDELIGVSLRQLIPESELAIHKSMLQRKLDGEESTRYEMRVFGKDRRQQHTLEVNSRLMFDGDRQPIGLHSIARDVSDRKAAEARQNILVRELQHRTKNLLAVIQSIAGNTLLHSADMRAAREALMGRLHALAHAQEFVASGSGGGAPLRELVEAELASFGARAKVDGEYLMAGSSFAQMFALIVHELATNAMKHGALSGADGEVAVSWRTSEREMEPTLQLRWQERGGPTVKAPASTGFGTQLISLIGKPQIAYHPEGFEYRLAVPLAEVGR
jgi:PAS domain S-box-containing protein